MYLIRRLLKLSKITVNIKLLGQDINPIFQEVGLCNKYEISIMNESKTGIVSTVLDSRTNTVKGKKMTIKDVKAQMLNDVFLRFRMEEYKKEGLKSVPVIEKFLGVKF